MWFYFARVLTVLFESIDCIDCYFLRVVINAYSQSNLFRLS